MKWYYKSNGTHVRVRVFMNGANCGELCFRIEEFNDIKRVYTNVEAHVKGCKIITFINDDIEASRVTIPR